MAVLNKVYLMGNLTRDPELRYTPSGTAVCEFGIAVNRRTSSAAEARPDDTCFVDITAWDKLADLCTKFLQKGSNVFIEGRLQYDTWTDKDQKKRSRLRVVAENVQFIGARRENMAPQDGTMPEQQPYRRQGAAPDQGTPQYGRQRSYAPQQGYTRPQQDQTLPPQMPSYTEPRTMQPAPEAQTPPPMDTGAAGMNNVQGIEDDIPF